MTNWQTAPDICSCGEFTNELSYNNTIIANQCRECGTLDWNIDQWEAQALLDTGFVFEDIQQDLILFAKGE